jgi:2-polyprenyl-6-methoxyphenol hydroxylase-like FAD-dependent oxidoreductase
MEALRHAPEADDLYCTPFEEVNLPVGSWSKGRIVLLGDSAHGQTAGGFGCAWGLVGAYILAGEIATLYNKDSSLAAAAVVQGAKNYEERFRPIATAMHGARDRFGSLFFPRSSFGIRLLHLFAGVAAHFKLEQGLGLDDKVSKWRLPDYPELERE